MVLNPRKFIDCGAVKSARGISPSQIQPNGIDLTLRELTVVGENGRFILFENDEKILTGRSIIKPRKNKLDPKQSIPSIMYGSSGKCYLLECHEYVEIPEGVCAFVYGRSTMNRNGLFIRSSVFDSGYKGYVGGILCAFSDFGLELGSRIAQIVFMESDNDRLYSGQYSQDFLR